MYTEEEKVKGYQIGIGIISAILVIAVGVMLYFIITGNKNNDNLRKEKEKLIEQYETTKLGLDAMTTSNAELSDALTIERDRTDSIINRLRQERNVNAATIKKYQAELGTLRGIMQGYVEQIKRLNDENTQLKEDNVQVRSDLQASKIQVRKSEEKSKELESQVRKGQMLSASGIGITPIRGNQREVSRIKRADNLRVDFTLMANAIADAGEKVVYVRLIDPSGYLISTSESLVFNFEGKKMPYTQSRTIDYQRESLKVSIFCPIGEGLEAGTYRIELYADGSLIGEREMSIR